MRIVRPRELWDHFKAKRRGEKKVAPYGTRGRVYQPAEGEPDMNAGNVMTVKKEPKVTIRAKVTRTDGTVEDHGVVASTEAGTVTTTER